MVMLFCTSYGCVLISVWSPPPEMWYWVFLWCLFSSLFVHGAVGLLMLVTLQRHRRGRLITLVLVSVGFLASLSGSVITSKSTHRALLMLLFCQILPLRPEQCSVSRSAWKKKKETGGDSFRQRERDGAELVLQLLSNRRRQGLTESEAFLTSYSFSFYFFVL